MHDIAFSIFSGVSFILVLLPLPLHWRARNASTILNILWLSVGNLIYFVNSLVWSDNTLNVAPVWCDIACKIIIGSQPALAGTSLCINRRLAVIASSKTVTVGQRQKRFALALDLFLGLAFPLLIMAASYVVQPHRFNIIEGVGCQVPEWPCLASIFILHLWPVLLSCISAVYGIIAVRFFLTRRLQFQALLKASSSGLDVGQYLRLMGVASSVLVLGLPLSIYYVYQTSLALQPWIGWDQIHLDWGFTSVVLLLPRWLFPLLALVFFLSFGVAEDVIGEYYRYLRKIAALLHIADLSDQKPKGAAYRPQLGTAISKPSGQLLGDDLSIKELDIDSLRLHPTDVSLSHRGLPLQGSSGINVVVHVEQDVA